MFHNNQRLLEQMPERLVTCFVRLCTDRARQAGQIKLLSELCVCNAQGITKNQSVICKHLLEENARVLLRLRVEDNKVQVPGDVGTPLPLGRAGVRDVLERLTTIGRAPLPGDLAPV